MARLSGGPWRRGTEKVVGERLVIREKGTLVGFKEETEMANSGVSCKEFTRSKAEYLDSAEDNFLEKKARGDQNTWMCCCSTAPTWDLDTSTAKDTAAPGTG